MTATLDTTDEKQEKTGKRKLSLSKARLPKVGLPKLSGKRWAAVGGVSVVLIGSLGTAAFSSMKWYEQSSLADAQNAAKKAACAYAPNLGNYDAANLDPFFKNVVAGATGDAKQRLQAAADYKELREVMKQAQAKSIVDDAQCGVRGGSKDHVDVVIVLASRTGTVATQGQMVPKQVGIVASMALTNGKWLVEKLDAPFLTQ